MDLITLGLSISTIAIIPLGAALKKSYANETRLVILETQNIAMTETARRIESKVDRLETKVDRLVERFL